MGTDEKGRIFDRISSIIISATDGKNGWHKSAILRNAGETLWKRKRSLSILKKAVRAYFIMASSYVAWQRVI